MKNWNLCFLAETQVERNSVLAAIDQATSQPTQESVQKAGTLAWDWVGRHPEDYAVWDACEPLSLLAECLKEKSGHASASDLVLSR